MVRDSCWGVSGGELHLTLHCHLQNYFCFKMCSDASHFGISFTDMNNISGFIKFGGEKSQDSIIHNCALTGLDDERDEH